MNKIDELINKWELQGMFSTPKIANQARAQIKDLVQQAVSEQKETMYLNMQYYMQYCQTKGYVTPQEWIEKHKHFEE